MDSFAALLIQSITPVTLISGVGLMLLCMTARYNHTTDRVRQLSNVVKTVTTKKNQISISKST